MHPTINIFLVYLSYVRYHFEIMNSSTKVRDISCELISPREEKMKENMILIDSNTVKELVFTT